MSWGRITPAGIWNRLYKFMDTIEMTKDICCYFYFHQCAGRICLFPTSNSVLGTFSNSFTSISFPISSFPRNLLWYYTWYFSPLLTKSELTWSHFIKEATPKSNLMLGRYQNTRFNQHCLSGAHQALDNKAGIFVINPIFWFLEVPMM